MKFTIGDKVIINSDFGDYDYGIVTGHQIRVRVLDEYGHERFYDERELVPRSIEEESTDDARRDD
jgi:hypothetical protein